MFRLHLERSTYRYFVSEKPDFLHYGSNVLDVRFFKTEEEADKYCKLYNNISDVIYRNPRLTKENILNRKEFEKVTGCVFSCTYFKTKEKDKLSFNFEDLYDLNPYSIHKTNLNMYGYGKYEKLESNSIQNSNIDINVYKLTDDELLFEISTNEKSMFYTLMV